MRCYRLAAVLTEVRTVVCLLPLPSGDSERPAELKKNHRLELSPRQVEAHVCSLDLLYRIFTSFCTVRAHCDVALNYCEAHFNSMLKKCALLDHLPFLSAERRRRMWRGVAMSVVYIFIRVRFYHKEMNLNVFLQSEQLFYCECIFILLCHEFNRKQK